MNDLMQFKKELDMRANTIYKTALPPHIKPETFSRYAYNYIAANPGLLDKNRASLFKSLMTLAQLGLPPEGVLGQAYLVPYKDQVQVIVGYQGILSLARQSGEISIIYAYPVYEKDQFSYSLGLHPDIKHVPAEGDRGALRYAYAVVVYKDDNRQFYVVGKHEIDKAKQSSAAVQGGKKDSPWFKYEEAMWCKTAVRRLRPFLPMTAQRAIALEEQYEQGKNANIKDDGMIEADIIPDEPTAEPEQEPPKKQAETPAKKEKGAIDPQAVFKNIFDDEGNQQIINELSGNAFTPIPRHMLDAFLAQWMQGKKSGLDDAARKAQEDTQAFLEKFAAYIASESNAQEALDSALK